MFFRNWFSAKRTFARKKFVHGLRSVLRSRLSLESLEERRVMAAQLANIYTGAPNSLPDLFTSVGSDTYFVATDSTHGEALWKTDGTSGGTSFVTELNAGSATSDDIQQLVNVNGTLFFYGTNGTNYELYKWDGSTRTRILPPSGTGNLDGAFFTNVNGTLYFRGHDSARSDNELYSITPGATNATLVADINPGASAQGSPLSLTNIGGKLYFFADNGTNGLEPMTYDGTTLTALGNLNPSGNS
jgi:ELWxxDGT repeat protein